ncbi:MAG: FAD-dependent oxidoreductase [Cyanobacteria bacterium P01_A01_bin.123]
MNDYDLVILGGALAARQGAIAAATEGARVALIEPDSDRVVQTLNHQALIAVARQVHQWQTSPIAQFLQPADGSDNRNTWAGLNAQPLDWSATLDWVTRISQAAIATHSLEQLALAGVDTLQGETQFCAAPKLHVTAANRKLTARSFLLLTGFTFQPPAITGLDQVPYCTPEQLWAWPTLPHRLAILGGTPTALELAQTFSTLGVAVTLWLPSNAALYGHDSSIAHWLIAHLQANGIDVRGEALPQLLPYAPAPSASPSPPIQLQFETEKVTVDQLIVATAPQLRLDGLCLNKLGIVSDRGTISVNSYLQTLYPNLFVGGTALGQRGIDAIASQEVTLALKNALLLPRFSLKPRLLPWTIRLNPEVAIVGVSEAEVKTWYGKDAWVLQTPLFENSRAQFEGKTIGFCKLIVHQRGEILGAVLVAPNASDLLQPVVQAMEQNLTVDAIASNPQIPLSWGNIVQQTADQWRQRKRQPGQWRRDWQENWFNWQRQD